MKTPLTAFRKSVTQTIRMVQSPGFFDHYDVDSLIDQLKPHVGATPKDIAAAAMASFCDGCRSHFQKIAAFAVGVYLEETYDCRTTTAEREADFLAMTKRTPRAYVDWIERNYDAD